MMLRPSQNNGLNGHERFIATIALLDSFGSNLILCNTKLMIKLRYETLMHIMHIHKSLPSILRKAEILMSFRYINGMADVKLDTKFPVLFDT